MLKAGLSHLIEIALAHPEHGPFVWPSAGEADMALQRQKVAARTLAEACELHQVAQSTAYVRKHRSQQRATIPTYPWWKTESIIVDGVEITYQKEMRSTQEMPGDAQYASPMPEPRVGSYVSISHLPTKSHSPPLPPLPPIACGGPKRRVSSASASERRRRRERTTRGRIPWHGVDAERKKLE
jgi:hypothetical protein